MISVKKKRWTALSRALGPFSQSCGAPLKPSICKCSISCILSSRCDSSLDGAVGWAWAWWAWEHGELEIRRRAMRVEAAEVVRPAENRRGAILVARRALASDIVVVEANGDGGDDDDEEEFAVSSLELSRPNGTSRVTLSQDHQPIKSHEILTRLCQNGHGLLRRQSKGQGVPSLRPG